MRVARPAQIVAILCVVSMNKRLGLVQVYTGNGKGKTSISMGLALRAAGQNFRVCIIQFLKGGAYTGEFLAIKNFLPQIEFLQFGKECAKEKKQLKLDGFAGRPKIDFIREEIECGDCRDCFFADKEEQMLAEKALEKAKKIIESNEYNFVILDEINNAMHKGLIGTQDVLAVLKNKPEHVEVILTGRNAPDEIIRISDLVTEMNEIKHPIDKGVVGRRGVEY